MNNGKDYTVLRGIVIYSIVLTVTITLKIAGVISISWAVALSPILIGMISLLGAAVIFVYGGTAECDDDEDAHYKQI